MLDALRWGAGAYSYRNGGYGSQGATRGERLLKSLLDESARVELAVSTRHSSKPECAPLRLPFIGHSGTHSWWEGRARGKDGIDFFSPFSFPFFFIWLFLPTAATTTLFNGRLTPGVEPNKSHTKSAQHIQSASKRPLSVGSAQRISLVGWFTEYATPIDPRPLKSLVHVEKPQKRKEKKRVE